jgi:hypothetical protein
MTSMSVQGVEVAAGGAALLFVVVWLTRRGLLSLRYGLGWITVAFLALAGSAFLGLVGPLARSLHITPTGLILGASSSFLLLLTLQLSISVSGLQDAVRDLSESNALLEQRIQEAEQFSDDGEPAPEGDTPTGLGRTGGGRR